MQAGVLDVNKRDVARQSQRRITTTAHVVHTTSSCAAHLPDVTKLTLLAFNNRNTEHQPDKTKSVTLWECVLYRLTPSASSPVASSSSYGYRYRPHQAAKRVEYLLYCTLLSARTDMEV